MATTKEIVAELIKNGATTETSTIAKISKSEDKEGRPRFCIYLETPVKGMVPGEDIEFVEGETRFVYCYPSQLRAAYKASNPAYANVADQLTRNAIAAHVALVGATLTVLIEKVGADVVYKNPFSSTDTEGKCYGYDTIMHHIIGVKLSKENVETAKETKRLILLGE